jgi:hypothetical protein
MDAPKSLLDKITEDPEFINRGVADATEPEPAQPVATQPVASAPASAAMPVSKPLPDHVEPLVLDRDPTFKRVVQPNLLLVRAKPVPGPRRVWPVAAVAIGVLAIASGAGTFVFLQGQPARVAVTTPRPSATPTPKPTPTPTPSATPTPTPSPTPVATPVPETVTAPAVTPTAEHPQAVKITSKSGLWLRSSPTSVNRSNIIGWMPNGATINVDNVGDFWWHGTYKGQAGYFAVKFTQ